MRKFNLLLCMLFSSTCVLAHAQDLSDQICLKGVFPDEPDKEGVLPSLADEDLGDPSTDSEEPPSEPEDSSHKKRTKDCKPQPKK